MKGATKFLLGVVMIIIALLILLALSVGYVYNVDILNIFPVSGAG